MDTNINIESMQEYEHSNKRFTNDEQTAEDDFSFECSLFDCSSFLLSGKLIIHQEHIDLFRPMSTLHKGFFNVCSAAGTGNIHDHGRETIAIFFFDAG